MALLAEPLMHSIAQIQMQAQQGDEDIAVLDEAFDKLAEAKQQLLAVPDAEPADTHDDAWYVLCRAFDDSFFQVDLRVLGILGRAKERVMEMEENFRRVDIDPQGEE